MEQHSNYSVEAEQSVLGGLILDNNKWDDIAHFIDEKHFYVSAHKVIFKAIKLLLNQNKPVDILTLEQTLKEQNVINDISLDYLADIAKNTPTAANIEAYADIVQRAYKVRLIASLGKSLQYEAQAITSQDKLDELIEKAEKYLTDISLDKANADTNVDIDDVFTKMLDRMMNNAMACSEVTGVSYGLTELNKLTAGGQNGELTVLAARPSMGKTALSLTFLLGALNHKQEQTVQYYSLEMPAIQLAERLTAMTGRLPLNRIKQPKDLDDFEYAKIGESVSKIKKLMAKRLIIDDTSSMTISMLRSRIRRNVRKFGVPSMILVDYLQLLSDPKMKQAGNRHNEISEIVRNLKAIAKEINCPVVALSQLNRSLENRQNKRPLLSDLRESGTIEEAADVILFIYRDDYYRQDDSELDNRAEIIIAKNRNGSTGTVIAQFEGQYSSFSDVDNVYYQ